MLNSTLTEFYVDTASAHEIAAVYNLRQPDDSYGWSWKTAVEVTHLLTNTTHSKIAPGPSFYRPPSDLYGYLMRTLSGIVSVQHSRNLSEDVRKKALRETKRWATRHHDTALQIYKQLVSPDNDNFHRWLDWAIIHAWPGHTEMLDGLFDAALIQPISGILEIPENDLSEIFQLSRAPSVVASYVATYVKDKSGGDAFDITRKAYTMGVLLRGRYHDIVACESKPPYQIKHHPIRQNKDLLLKLPGTPRTTLEATNTGKYLSSILLGSGFAEKEPRNRISLWADNVREVGTKILSGEIELPEKEHDDFALNHAIDIARRQCDIRLSPRLIEKIINVTITAGVIGVTTYLLKDWQLASAIVGGGAAYASAKKGGTFGPWVAAKFYRTEKRLRNLATLRAGRIE